MITDKNKDQKIPDEAYRELPFREEAVAAAQSLSTLRSTCVVVEMEMGWFARSRSLDDARVAEVIGGDDVDPRMYNLNTKLYAQNDPAIKRMNEARTALLAYRDSKTIPLPALPVNVQVSVHLPEDGGPKRLLKQPGKRLILVTDVDEFHRTICAVLIPNLVEAARDATQQRAEILQRAKEKLGKDFDPSKYPAEFLVVVRGPTYHELATNSSFEQLCPYAAAQLKTTYDSYLRDTVETAAADFARQFLDVVNTTAAQLGSRTRLSPTDVKWSKYKDAEVVEIRTATDDVDIPEDHVEIDVVYRLESGGKLSKPETLGPFPRDFYETVLRPASGTERRKLFGSTMERLMSDLQRFNDIRAMLGDAAAPLATIVDGVRAALRGHDDAEGLLAQLKRSDSFRDATSLALDHVADALEEIVVGYGDQPKRRRRLKI